MESIINPRKISIDFFKNGRHILAMVNKMTRDIRAALFDLDGTLLDTLRDIGEAMNRVLMKHGLPGHTISAYRHLIGAGTAMLCTGAHPT